MTNAFDKADGLRRKCKLTKLESAAYFASAGHFLRVPRSS